MKKEALISLFGSVKGKGTLDIEPGSDDPIYRPLGMEFPGLIETQAYKDPSTLFIMKLFEKLGQVQRKEITA